MLEGRKLMQGTNLRNNKRVRWPEPLTLDNVLYPERNTGDLVVYDYKHILGY